MFPVDAPMLEDTMDTPVPFQKYNPPDEWLDFSTLSTRLLTQRCPMTLSTMERRTDHPSAIVRSSPVSYSSCAVPVLDSYHRLSQVRTSVAADFQAFPESNIQDNSPKTQPHQETLDLEELLELEEKRSSAWNWWWRWW